MNNNFTNKETNKMIKKIIASISAVAMSFCAFSSIVLADSYSVGIKSGVTKTETAGDYGEQYFIIDCADIANKSAFLNSFKIDLEFTNVNPEEGYWNVNKTPNDTAFSGGLYYTKKVMGKDKTYYITDLNDSQFKDNGDGTQKMSLLFDKSDVGRISDDGAIVEVFVFPQDADKDITVKVLNSTNVIVYDTSDTELVNGTTHYTTDEKTYTLKAGTSTIATEDVAHNVNVVSNDDYAITATPATAKKGEEVKLAIDIKKSGYELDYYTVDGTQIEGNTFTMPDADVTVDAVLKETVVDDNTVKPIPAEDGENYYKDGNNDYAVAFKKTFTDNAAKTYTMQALIDGKTYDYQKTFALPDVSGDINVGVIIQYNPNAEGAINFSNIESLTFIEK